MKRFLHELMKISNIINDRATSPLKGRCITGGNTPRFAVLKAPFIRNDVKKPVEVIEEKVLTPEVNETQDLLSGISSTPDIISSDANVIPPKTVTECLNSASESSINDVVVHDKAIGWYGVPGEFLDVDVCLGKYQIKSELSFWKAWKLISNVEQLSLAIHIRLLKESSGSSAERLYFVVEDDSTASSSTKAKRLDSFIRPDLSTEHDRYSLVVRNIRPDLCFEIGILALKTTSICVKKVQLSFSIVPSTSDVPSDRLFPLEFELNKEFNFKKWRQRQLQSFQRFHRKISHFIKTTYGVTSSEVYMQRCQSRACFDCRSKAEVDLTFPIYCLAENCAGNLVDTDYRSMAYLQKLTAGLVGADAGKALEKAVVFNWRRWKQRDEKYRRKKDMTEIKVDSLYYDACVQNKLFCPSCWKVEPYLDAWFRQNAERNGKFYQSKCQTCWRYYAQADISFDIGRFESRMRERDLRREERLQAVVRSLEDRKAEYHPYRFIDKIEEKWKREHPDRNWTPSSLLYKTLPDFRVTLANEKEDLLPSVMVKDLDLSDVSDGDADMIVFEQSFSTLSGDEGVDLLEGADGEESVSTPIREIVSDHLNREAGKGEGNKGDSLVVPISSLHADKDKGKEVQEDEIHLMNLPCDCALCRKIAIRDAAAARAREAPAPSASNNLIAQGNVPSDETGSLKPKQQLPSLPNEQLHDVKSVDVGGLADNEKDKLPKGKPSQRPMTALPLSKASSQGGLVDQVRGNVAKHRAVSFSTQLEIQMSDSLASTTTKHIAGELNVADAVETMLQSISGIGDASPIPDPATPLAEGKTPNPKHKRTKSSRKKSSSHRSSRLLDSEGLVPKQGKSSPAVQLRDREGDLAVQSRSIDLSDGSPMPSDLNINIDLNRIIDRPNFEDDRYNLSLTPMLSQAAAPQSRGRPSSLQAGSTSKGSQGDRSISNLSGSYEDHIPVEDHAHQRFERWLRGIAGMIPIGALRNSVHGSAQLERTDFEGAQTPTNHFLPHLQDMMGVAAEESHHRPLISSYTIRVSFVYNEKARSLTEFNPVTHIGEKKLLFTRARSRDSFQTVSDPVATDRMVYLVGCCNSGSRERAYYFVSPLYSQPYPKTSERAPNSKVLGGFQYFKRASVILRSTTRCEYLLEKLQTNSESVRMVRTPKSPKSRDTNLTMEDMRRRARAGFSPGAFDSAATTVKFSWKTIASLPMQDYLATLPEDVFFVVNLAQHEVDSDGQTIVDVEYHFVVRCLVGGEEILHGTFLCHRYFALSEFESKCHLRVTDPVDIRQEAYFVFFEIQHAHKLCDGVEILCAS